MNKWFGYILIVGGLLCSTTTFASTTVDQLLERASKAIQEKNYKGRFIYEFGNTRETLELVHAVKGGVEFERIYHLSGIEREFLRAGREQDCVSVGGLLMRGGLVSARGNTVSLSQNYHFYIQGQGRVADRPVSIIQAMPKDQYRYGLTLAIDEESGLPLMSLTTASSKTAIERFQFVQIDVDEDISNQDLSPAKPLHKRLDGSSSPCTKTNNPINKSAWVASWVPPGFVLSQVSEDGKGGGALTYTDGIASFTVFISMVEPGQSIKQGVVHRGATIALMTHLPYEPQQVSVILVGEVPLLTAERVAVSLRLIH